MPTNLGVNLGGDLFCVGGGIGLKPWRKKAEKFTGKILLRNSTQIRPAEPRDQNDRIGKDAD